MIMLNFCYNIRPTMKYIPLHQSKRLFSAKVAGILVLSIILGIVAPRAFANQYEAQIQNLQNQNNEKQQNISRLEVEASGIEDKVSKLNEQITGLENEIAANQTKKQSLENEIAAAEAELVKQKSVLGSNIKAMYLESDISTLEMLASSKDLSEFVDKQAYRTAVEAKITATLENINQLKLKLKEQQVQVAAIIKEKQQIQEQIISQKSEQTRLLSLNQSDRASTDQEIKANYEKIKVLKQKQAEENMRLFGGGNGGSVGGGGYPWGNAVCIHTGKVGGACPNYDWAVGGSIWNWQTGGYGYRNCTDWVAFKIKSQGKFLPGGLGHAKSWDDRASGFGLRVTSTPTVGAAAISNSGTYGHVMYVEQVYGDGSILISDYNRAGTGLYNTSTLSAGTASQLNYVIF